MRAARPLAVNLLSVLGEIRNHGGNGSSNDGGGSGGGIGGDEVERWQQSSKRRLAVMLSDQVWHM